MLQGVTGWYRVGTEFVKGGCRDVADLLLELSDVLKDIYRSVTRGEIFSIPYCRLKLHFFFFFQIFQCVFCVGLDLTIK